MTTQLHSHASAFGKVILIGEHAVVYGQPAVAAGLPDGLHLRARPLDNTRSPSTVTIAAWGIDELLRVDNEHPVARATLEVLGICDGPLTGWAITGDSHLPCRAGCGSSAALSVALAKLVLGPEASASDIIEASLVGERVFHGEPSGIDNLVATLGGVVRFVRGQDAEQITLPRALPLILIPTGIPRSTAKLVAAVRARVERLPTLGRPILSAIGNATDAAIQSLKNSNYNELGEIMTVVHELLSSLGVSRPELDSLCTLALSAGALGAKLTGAGGGGCVLALAPAAPGPLLTTLQTAGHQPLAMEVQ